MPDRHCDTCPYRRLDESGDTEQAQERLLQNGRLSAAKFYAQPEDNRAGRRLPEALIPVGQLRIINYKYIIRGPFSYAIAVALQLTALAVETHIVASSSLSRARAFNKSVDFFVMLFIGEVPHVKTGLR